MKIINTILALLLICASPVIFADDGYGHHRHHGYHGHAKHHEYRGHHGHHEHRGYHRY